MENTPNIGLKRWDGGDRVLRTDFNENWDKLDAAVGKVEQASTLHTILDVTTDKDEDKLILPLNMNWSEWKTVHIDVVPAEGSASNLMICYAPTTFDKICGMDTMWNRIVAFPCGNSEMPLFVMVLQGSGGQLKRCGTYVRYKNFISIMITSENGTSWLKAGSRIRVLGERM